MHRVIYPPLWSLHRIVPSPQISLLLPLFLLAVLLCKVRMLPLENTIMVLTGHGWEFSQKLINNSLLLGAGGKGLGNGKQYGSRLCISGVKIEKGQRNCSCPQRWPRAGLKLIAVLSSFERSAQPQTRKASLQAAELRPILLTPSQDWAVVKGLASFPDC